MLIWKNFAFKSVAQFGPIPHCFWLPINDPHDYLTSIVSLVNLIVQTTIGISFIIISLVVFEKKGGGRKMSPVKNSKFLLGQNGVKQNKAQFTGQGYRRCGKSFSQISHTVIRSLRLIRISFVNKT